MSLWMHLTGLKRIKNWSLPDTAPIRPDEKSIFRSRIEETYNWEKITAQTIKVYEKALAK